MQSALIWVVGEALIDLLPGEIPVVGGGPANTSKALAGLGIPASFVGGISTDRYGELIESELSEFNVNLDLVNKSNLRTAQAIVSLDESGAATYQFELANTATFDFRNWLPVGSPSIVHIGSLATIVEPGASNLFKWARDLDALVVFDPNVRRSVLSERDVYRVYFEKWTKISDVVKLSDEDLSWLGFTPDEILDFGVDLVVVTHGENGLSGFRKGEKYSVAGVVVDVMDTVGAGDTVGAVLVEGLIKYGELSGENLEMVLKRAVVAAAITCTRAGAKPPSLSELESFR